MSQTPMAFQWTGEAMIPRLPRHADRMFTVGQVYTLVEQVERSSASHRHYFALINEAFNSLPEHIADRWSTPDHLRKWCLIKAGYRDERSIVCASKAEALRVKSFIRPIDDFAVVVASEAVVTVYTAKSQSLKAMGRAEFQASKDAVITALADLIGVEPTTLSRQSEAA